MTPLVYTMPRETAQNDDVSTWLPPSLHTPWRNVFFEYINKKKHKIIARDLDSSLIMPKHAKHDQNKLSEYIYQRAGNITKS